LKHEEDAPEQLSAFGPKKAKLSKNMVNASKPFELEELNAEDSVRLWHCIRSLLPFQFAFDWVQE
jgi:hypothetical protein